MSKKDYVLIAQTINTLLVKGTQHYENNRAQLWVYGRRDGLIEAAQGMAQVLAEENPRFDKAKFLKACGVNNA